MISLSSVGLGLSIVLGCLLLAIVAELFYLLWWKKNITNTEIEDDHHITPEREFLNMFCSNNQPLPLRSSTPLTNQELCSSVIITETHVNEPQQGQPNKDLWWFKPFGGEDDLQNLWGPPRFLCTIHEETKEDLDLESEDEKGSMNRSLSDLSYVSMGNSEAFLTPIASPPYFTPPLTPTDSLYDHLGFTNPLFGSSFDAEFNRIRLSPPPKFKILRAAENKLYKERG